MNEESRECLCEKVIELLSETKRGIEKEYSKNKMVNADFVRTQKAMFYEKVDKLFFKK